MGSPTLWNPLSPYIHNTFKSCLITLCFNMVSVIQWSLTIIPPSTFSATPNYGLQIYSYQFPVFVLLYSQSTHSLSYLQVVLSRNLKVSSCTVLSELVQVLSTTIAIHYLAFGATNQYSLVLNMKKLAVLLHQSQNFSTCT